MGICGLGPVLDAAGQRYFDQIVGPDLKELKQLQLSNDDLQRLYKVFSKIDQDSSGQIATWELLEFLKLERTKFTKRVFRIFDEDGSGQICFKEFVSACWNYCTLSKSSLILFAFSLYDSDGSGSIDAKEVARMLREVYGSSADTNMHAIRIKSALDEKAENSTLTVGEFTTFTNKHPALLFPAFQLQMDIRKHVVGESFWSRASASRIELSNGSYISINQLLKARVDRNHFEDLMQASHMVTTEGVLATLDPTARATVRAIISNREKNINGGGPEDEALAKRKASEANVDSARRMGSKTGGNSSRPSLAAGAKVVVVANRMLSKVGGTSSSARVVVAPPDEEEDLDNKQPSDAAASAADKLLPSDAATHQHTTGRNERKSLDKKSANITATAGHDEATHPNVKKGTTRSGRKG